MDYFEILKRIIVIATFISYTAGVCTWPTSFVSSTWLDSEAGAVVFETTNLTGFAITVGVVPKTLNTWECVLFDSVNSYLIMKTTESFEQFVNNFFTAYKCLQLTQITDVSYRYYEIARVQQNVQHKRLEFNNDPNLTNVTVLCQESYGATGSEYRVIVKSGFESSARVMCPYNIVANYSYTYNSSDGSVSCDSSTDVGQIDMCSSTTNMAFQYPACTSLTFYTSASSIWCADVVTEGSDVFVTLYNGDQSSATIDGSSTYSFSCIGINSDGTLASVTPQYCKGNQSTSVVPIDNAGTSVGAVLSLSRTGDYCPPCPILSAPARGNVSVATDGAVTTATYVCEGNYTLAGDATRTCQSNGTWSGSSPSCTCPLPATPSNGSVKLSADGTTLTYTCNVGTVLNGVTTRTCQTATNTWTDNDPSCDTCSTLTQPQNGSFVLSSTGVTSVAAYSCDVGTSLNGNNNRTCQTDTTWDGSDPVCLSCPTLPDPDSGTVNITSNSIVSTATYTCVTSYHIVGVNSTTCNSSGLWESTAPSCVCDVPVQPSNGTVVVTSSGFMATFTCDVGFTLSGEDTLTCQTAGAGWNATFPTCVECTNVTSPTNGSLTFSTNGSITMATYTCNVGFTLNGSSVASCSTSGSWSTTSPLCAQCDTLAAPTSGNVTFISDGTTTSALYTCDVGSTLRGNVTAECDSSGSWSTSSSSASCVACPNLSSVTGGTFEISSNGTTSIATMTCQSGYTVSGISDATCLSDGTWSPTTPTCVKDSTSNDNTDDSLLPAVIALAIISALLLAALVASIIYIWRNRKNKDKRDKEEIHQHEKMSPTGTDSLAIIGRMLSEASKSSAAPTGHQRPVFNGTSSLSRAPSSHRTDSRDFLTTRTTSPTSLTSDPVTPRSVKSVASAGNMKLSLVKEATSGSILDESTPAPWTVHSNSHFSSKPSNSYKTSDQNERGQATISTKKQTVQTPRRNENKSNPLIPSQYREQNKSKLTITNGTQSKESLKLDLSSIHENKTSNKKTKTKSPIKEIHLKVHRNEGHSERATTPVHHSLSVKDTETPRTPRSGTITTVY